MGNLSINEDSGRYGEEGGHCVFSQWDAKHGPAHLKNIAVWDGCHTEGYKLKDGIGMVGKLGADNNSDGLLFPKRTPSSLTKAVMTSSKADAKALTTEFSFCRGKRLLYKVSHLKKEAGDDA